MFVLTQILRCGAGRQKEALKRLHWIHGLMAERPDSCGCIVAKHLGNPIDLMILRYWETHDAMMRRTNSYYQEPWPLFPPNEPEGIYQTQNIAHHFEAVLSTDGNATGDFIWRITLRVPQDKWDRFIALRQADDLIMQKSSGLVRASTFRGVDDPTEVFLTVRLQDRSALEEFAVNPERLALQAQINEIAAPLEYPDLNIFYSECFEVVDEFVR
jgi:hypothetical protein